MADCKAQENIYPLFQTPPKSPGNRITASSHGSGSPGKSPLKRKTNLIIRQGSTQNNKIFRYLQPKRLLDESDVSRPQLSAEFTSEDKENEEYELKVVLSRIDEGDQDYSYCQVHETVRKACCCNREESSESEQIVEALDNTIQDFYSSPTHRLGIPSVLCLKQPGCQHLERPAFFSTAQENLFLTMMNSDLSTTMIRECLQKTSPEKFPSPSLVHSIVRIMEVSIEQPTLFYCKALLKKLLYLHPPCAPNMRQFYVSVLHTQNVEMKVPMDYWTITSCENFQSILRELEDCIDGMLSPAQRKLKLKIPTVRKVSKPLRFRQSPSPVKRPRRSTPINKEWTLNAERRRIQLNFESSDDRTAEDLDDMTEQARKKRLKFESSLEAMTPLQKLEHIFTKFDFFVDVLEYDLVVWLNNHSDAACSIRDRVSCPLIVIALWKPAADTGYDSVDCRRIFSLYSSSWTLKVHPKHLKTLSRLIGLIAEVIFSSDPSNKRAFPGMGDRCDNLSRRIAEVLNNDRLKPNVYEAVQMLKPVWLQMLVSASLLGVPPSISSVDPIKLEQSQYSLWNVFLESAVSTYQIREVNTFLKRASLGNTSVVTSNHQPLVQPMYTINYRKLLNEIVAFYQLKCKLNVRENVLHHSNLLWLCQ